MTPEKRRTRGIFIVTLSIFQTNVEAGTTFSAGDTT